MNPRKRYDTYIDNDCDRLLRDIDTNRLRAGKYADLVSTKKVTGGVNHDKRIEQHQSKQGEQQTV